MSGIKGSAMSKCHGQDLIEADDTVGVAEDSVSVELGVQASDDVTENEGGNLDEESKVPKDKGWAWFVLLGQSFSIQSFLLLLLLSLFISVCVCVCVSVCLSVCLIDKIITYCYLQ